MRSNHQGFSSPESPSALTRVMLPIMGRLKILKSVPEREEALAKAIRGTQFDNPYWPEVLTSQLTEAGVKESADAHLLALMALRAGDPEGLSRIALQITPEHDLVRAFINGMSIAAPEFVARISSGKMDSDQLMVRIALTHIFRRDTSNALQLFVIDAMVKKFLPATKMTVGGFVREIQSNPDAAPAPADAWGYVLVLDGIRGHMGIYLTADDDSIENNLGRLVPVMRAEMGLEASDEAVAHALVASALDVSMASKGGGARALMLACAARLTQRTYFAVYIGRDDAGSRTTIIPIEATSVEDARRKAGAKPELYLQQAIRDLAERTEPDTYEGLKQ